VTAIAKVWMTRRLVRDDPRGCGRGHLFIAVTGQFALNNIRT